MYMIKLYELSEKENNALRERKRKEFLAAIEPAVEPMVEEYEDDYVGLSQEEIDSFIEEEEEYFRPENYSKPLNYKMGDAAKRIYAMMFSSDKVSRICKAGVTYVVSRLRKRMNTVKKLTTAVKHVFRDNKTVSDDTVSNIVLTVIRNSNSSSTFGIPDIINTS